MRLQNKKILITGGATGIGKASAIEMAKHGAQIALLDINEKGLMETKKQISIFNENIDYWVTDIRSETEMKKNISKAIKWLGNELNVLAHFAGILEGSLVDLENLNSEIWKKVLEINVTGTFYAVKYSLPWLKKSKSVLLLTSSGAGVTGAGSAAPYSSSKGGTHGLTLWLENNLKDTEIRVHDILPGGIETPLKLGQLNEALDNSKDTKTFEENKKSLGTPEGVAKIVAFIASDDADYLRGSIRTR
tara:strand:- start:1297 stop:2037 length:741 start_codon:yes stop_codon:yes gene_type:complete